MILNNLKTSGSIHPSIIQKSMFDLLGRKKNLVVEAPSSSGKTTGALLFMLCQQVSLKTGKSIGIIVPSHNFINNVYQNLFNICKHSNVRLVNLDSQKEVDKEAGKDNITVFIGSYSSFFKSFSDSSIPVEEFVGFIFDDIEYSISLGNNQKLIQLCRFLVAKLPEEQRNFILVSGNSELDTFKDLKESFGVKFTNLRLVGEDKEEQNGDKSGEQQDDEARAELLKLMIKQYYYIGSEIQLYSCLYLIAKFDIFKGPILLITENLEQAYKLKILADRAHFGEAQVYNTEGVLNVRAYNLALFNGGSIRFLIATKDLLKDLKKNKKSVQSLKNIKNIVFFNCELDFEIYSSYLNLFKGTLNTVNAKSAEIGYKILCMAAQKVEEELKPKEALMNLLSKQKSKYGQVLMQPLPVPVGDIDAFSYRIETVVNPITNKRIKLFRLIELKRQILKNANMKVIHD